MSLLYYPRGFRYRAWESYRIPTDCQSLGHSRDRSLLLPQGEPCVNHLYAQYCANHGFFWTLERIEELVAVAQYVVPNLQEFFTLQMQNSQLHKHQVDFLQETIAKLNFGIDRTLSPMAYMQLMENFPTYRGRIKHKGIMPILINNRPASNQRLIQLWMSCPNGCNDLLESLYIFFGAPRAS